MMPQTRKAYIETSMQGPRSIGLASLVLLALVLPADAQIPGIELEHVAPMEQPDYRLSYVVAEDSTPQRPDLFVWRQYRVDVGISGSRGLRSGHRDTAVSTTLVFCIGNFSVIFDSRQRSTRLP